MTSEDILRREIDFVKLTKGEKVARNLERAYRQFCKQSNVTDAFSIFKAGFLANKRGK